MRREFEARIEELEQQLRASRRVVDALIWRAERRSEALLFEPDQNGIIKALWNLEGIVEERTRALYESEARYRALYDHSPDMLFTVDADGRITAVNKTSLAAFDCEEDALLGCELASLFDEEAQPLVERWLGSCTSPLPDQEVMLDDGRVVSIKGAVVPGSRGEIQVVLRDVSMRRRLEAELGHARRLAAIGHLAAGVAHEINNPLTVVQLRLELLESYDLPAHVTEQMSVMAEHVQRIARIVRNLQSFAHPRAEPPETVGLLDLVEGAREVAGAALSEVSFRCEMPTGLLVRVDRQRAEQVLVNLFTNAIHAQKGAGWIGLSATVDGDRVRIVVEDAGPGIPSDLIDHVFTPFVSGKGLAGSGLGLAIAWSIVQEHGGTMIASNRPQGGACFEFTLPLGSEPTEPPAPDEPEPPCGSERSLRILAIDDEPSLLDLIDAFAEGAGHRVEKVMTAEAALELLSRDARFDIVLSDIRLPGMSGRDLLRLLRRDRPELARRTILMSGFFHQPGTGVPYLQKPFGRRDLLALLTDVSEAAARAADE